MKHIGKIGVAVAIAVTAWFLLVGAHILEASGRNSTARADAAIVLGAAIRGNRPSPVFEERIRHGVALHNAGRVRTLILTGGRGEGAAYSESAVARLYAIRHGVPSGDILVESSSKTTRQNLVEARKLMRASGMRTALVVSDPLHMARASRMARDLELVAEPSPTPTTRYRSWRARAGFLARETFFLTYYLATGD